MNSKQLWPREARLRFETGEPIYFEDGKKVKNELELINAIVKGLILCKNF